MASERWPSPSGRVLPVVIDPVDWAEVPEYLKAVVALNPRASAAAETEAVLARWSKRGQGWARATVGVAVTVYAGAGLTFVGEVFHWPTPAAVHWLWVPFAFFVAGALAVSAFVRLRRAQMTRRGWVVFVATLALLAAVCSGASCRAFRNQNPPLVDVVDPDL